MTANKKVFDIRNNYVTTPVTTAAIVQLSAAISHDVRAVEVFDSSGQAMELYYGPAGSEVSALKIIPGGNELRPLLLNKGMRLGVKAVSADATVGELTINFYY